MKVFSQLEKAQLENTTSDTASHPKGMITYRTDLNQAKVSNGTAYKLLIDEDSTQTLSNKTYASPITSGAITAAQTATPANPSSGSNKLYFKADGKLYTLDSAGNEALVGSGGGGVKNLITNGNADDSASSIFVPYADSGTRPTDGTGGSPTVTTSVTTSSPLDGTKSYLLTKPASNVQGQGWAVPFSVDPAYRAKSLKISADFIVNSGTFVAGSNGASPTDGDLIWTIYDVTNSQIIEPSNIKMFSNSSTISDKFEAEFQTSATGSSYRLIAHVASTSALAWELKVDNITTSPQNYAYGSNDTEWAAYTPTFTGFGTVTNISIFWRRVGTSIETYGRFTTGTVSATLATMSLPPGITVGGAVGLRNYYGVVNRNGGSHLQLMAIESQTVFRFGGGAGSHGDLNGNDILGTGETVYFNSWGVPITGAAASSRMSDGYDGRLISTKVRNNANVTANNGVQFKMTFGSVEFDKTGSWDSTNNLWRCPSQGVYEVKAVIGYPGVSGTGARVTYIYKNGSYYNEIGIPPVTNGGATQVINATEIELNANDYIEVYGVQTGGTNMTINSTNNILSISKKQSPQTTSQGALVSASYNQSSGQALPNATVTIVNYSNKLEDSHGLVVVGGSWRFTAQEQGEYQVNAGVLIAGGNSLPAGSECNLALYKNGSDFKVLNSHYGQTASTAAIPLNGSAKVKLNAGDYIDIRAYQTTGATSNLLTQSRFNYVDVFKV